MTLPGARAEASGTLRGHELPEKRSSSEFGSSSAGWRDSMTLWTGVLKQQGNEDVARVTEEEELSKRNESEVDQRLTHHGSGNGCDAGKGGVHRDSAEASPLTSSSSSAPSSGPKGSASPSEPASKRLKRQ